MKYLAKVENGIVVNTAIAENNFFPSDNGWIECSEDTLPGIDYTYTEIEGFRPPKIFNSWIWNETGKYWESPIKNPTDEKNIYEWDEETTSWKLTHIKYTQ